MVDKEDNLMSYVWVYLYISYIVIHHPTCGACYLESYASQNFCTKREYCLCIQNPWTKFVPWVSTISTYMRYLPVVQVNLHVPISKPSNDNLFCMPEPLMYQLGLSVSSMLGGSFSRGVDSAPHSRENGWSPGCPAPCFMQNRTPPGTVASWRHSLFRASHGLMLVGGGGV